MSQRFRVERSQAIKRLATAFEALIKLAKLILRRLLAEIGCIPLSPALFELTPRGFELLLRFGDFSLEPLSQRRKLLHALRLILHRHREGIESLTAVVNHLLGLFAL